MKKRKQRLAAVFTTLIFAAAVIYSINKFISKKAVSKHFLQKKDTSIYAWRFGNIHYVKTGSGSPLLLLHELSPCSSSYEWHRIVKALSTRHTVYCVDLPGCGLSDKQKITYTNFYYVQFVVDFIKSVIGSPVTILATGLSASVSVTACSYEPGLFQKLILINPPDIHTLARIPSKKSRISKALLECPLTGTMIYYSIVAKEKIRKEFRDRLFSDSSSVRTEYVDAYYEASHWGGYFGKYLYASIIGNYMYLDIRHALQSIDQDIVILGGARQEGMNETILFYQAVNPAVESVLIPDTKHLPHLEAPEKVLDQLKIFI